MKLNVDASSVLVGLAALAALAVGVFVWRKFDLGVKLDPTNPENLLYKGSSSLVSAAAGREESVGTVAYNATASIGAAWRWITNTESTDDVDYAGAVTDAERRLVKRESANVNPRDLR